MELGGQTLSQTIPQRLFHELACFLAFHSSKSFRFQLCFTGRRHDDFDDLIQAAPPTLMVSFTLPSASWDSVTL